MPTAPDRRTTGALAGVALALCAACAGAGRPPSGQAPAGVGSWSVQVLELRDAALNARDVDAAANAYAVDAVVVDADLGAVVLRGRAEIRAAHARFLEACPRARVEIVDRSFAEQGRIVTDLERVRCNWTPPVEGWVRYQIVGGAIVGVVKHHSPPFGG